MSIELELVVRRHLNVQTSTPGTDLRSSILEEVDRTESVLCYWETIAHSIPMKYEPYSIQLLKVITELWIAIRGHSLANIVATFKTYQVSRPRPIMNNGENEDEQTSQQTSHLEPSTEENWENYADFPQGRLNSDLTYELQVEYRTNPEHHEQ